MSLWEGDNARKRRSYRSEREFGLLVGGVLAALGGLGLYRSGFNPAPMIAVALGGLLFVLGALAPAALVLPNRAWMGLAAALSFVMTPSILAIIFFGVVTPIGLVKRMSGSDPLRRRAKPSDSYWSDYSKRQRNTRHYDKMF